MKQISDLSDIISDIKGASVERPNKVGTLSGHAAGEPFEKKVYEILKSKYPINIFKQYEYLNDLYLRNPEHTTTEDRYALLDLLTMQFLLSRGDKVTKEWRPDNLFEEKQNDTADIVFFDKGKYSLIDVKTRNISKKSQAPNIISAYKLARMCEIMLENNEFEQFRIQYVEIDWTESRGELKCSDYHCADLFKAQPSDLYINWAAAMQIQFHACDLEQSWNGSMEDWCREYLRCFVESANARCDKMKTNFIDPFAKYID